MHMQQGETFHFDIQAVIDQTGLDLEDYMEIYALFQENFQELAQEIQDAWTAKDSDRIMRAAHTLKGSTSNIGFLPLSDLAKEMQCSPSDFQAVEKNLALIRREYERLDREVRSVLAQSAR